MLIVRKIILIKTTVTAHFDGLRFKILYLRFKWDCLFSTDTFDWSENVLSSEDWGIFGEDSRVALEESVSLDSISLLISAFEQKKTIYMLLVIISIDKIYLMMAFYHPLHLLLIDRWIILFLVMTRNFVVVDLFDVLWKKIWYLSSIENSPYVLIFEQYFDNEFY
jgi:hypothetical protein